MAVQKIKKKEYIVKNKESVIENESNFCQKIVI